MEEEEEEDNVEEIDEATEEAMEDAEEEAPQQSFDTTVTNWDTSQTCAWTSPKHERQT